MNHKERLSGPNWLYQSHYHQLEMLDAIFEQNQLILENQSLILKNQKTMGDTQTAEAASIEAIATGLTGIGKAVQALQAEITAQGDAASPALTQAGSDLAAAFTALNNIVNPPAPAPAPGP
jgi:hypothetical protein